MLKDSSWKLNIYETLESVLIFAYSISCVEHNNCGCNSLLGAHFNKLTVLHSNFLKIISLTVSWNDWGLLFAKQVTEEF